jgi:hypothetical protein
MNRDRRLRKAFGENEVGLADVPKKISGVMVSRILVGRESGCSHCFQHGFETVNSHIINRQRNWKKQRKTRWK